MTSYGTLFYTQSDNTLNSPSIKIFTADIIYHLTDQFSKHLEDQKKRKQEELKHVAIFPAIMKILPNCVFCKRDPIIVGVKILDGQLRVGSPICVPAKVREQIRFYSTFWTEFRL